MGKHLLLDSGSFSRKYSKLCPLSKSLCVGVRFCVYQRQEWFYLSECQVSPLVTVRTLENRLRALWGGGSTGLRAVQGHSRENLSELLWWRIRIAEFGNTWDLQCTGLQCTGTNKPAPLQLTLWSACENECVDYYLQILTVFEGLWLLSFYNTNEKNDPQGWH